VVAQEEHEQLELGRRERHRARPPAHPATEQVDLDVLGAQRVGRHLRDHAQLRAHTGHELGHRERLDQVVHGARVEPFDTILDLTSSGQHDDRDARHRTVHGREDLKAAAARQHQVQHDRFEAALQGQALALDPIQCGLDGKALRLQATSHEVHDPRLILDQEHPGRVLGGHPASGILLDGRWGGSARVSGIGHPTRIGNDRRSAFPACNFQ